MAEKKIDLLQLVCVAIGIMIGMILFRAVLDFSPIIGGALGGGLGAGGGLLLYALILKIKG